MPITKDVNTKANIRQKTDADLLSNLGQPVIAKFEETSQAAQTLIPASGSLPFFVDQNNKENFELFVDGRLLREGASHDYTFTQIDQNNASAKILLNASLAAGLNIIAIKRGIKKEVELGIDSRISAIQDYASAGFQGFVDESATIAVPNTQIINRKRIPNLANDLRARMGIDRITIQQLVELVDEFGPNGEKVHKLFEDDRDLIRFVGSWIVNAIDTDGVRPYTQSTSDYFEVTFYGTGLNLLMPFHASAFDLRVTVDGGSESGNVVPAGSTSGVGSGRRYNANQIVPLVSGLSLGLHTVKVRNGQGTFFQYVQGVEILNESTTIKVQPGNAYLANKKIANSSQSLLSYNTGFDSILRDGASVGSLGSRGARVLVYLKSDGTIGKSAVAVDSTQKSMGLTDHSNEEMVRAYHWREFGAGRTDDFNSLTLTPSAARSFTLDDGTTTLLANTVAKAVQVTVADALQMTAGGAYITITFVGTGIDLESYGDVNAAGDPHAFILDGVTVATLSTATVANQRFFTRIASGLPYGTHVLRINRNTAVSGSAFNFSKYYVYGPKKPTLPAGAVEIADYNVMADFVANTTANQDFISTGVLRKAANREFIYTGTWSATQDVVNTMTGTYFTSNTNGGWYQTTFFGTGFDLRFRADVNRPTSISVTLNGTLATTANFPSMVTSTYGTGVVYTAATGILDQQDAASTNGSGFRLSGLPLGLYTVRFTNNTANSTLVDALDIITPVHATKFYNGNLQNVLPIGSCAISDNRKVSPIKAQTTKKAWAQAVGITSSPTTTSTTFVPVPEMAVTVTTEEGLLSLHSCFYGANSAVGSVVQFVVDGILVGKPVTWTGNINIGQAISAMVPVSKGVHRVELHWKASSAGTISMNGDARVMSVREL